MSTTSILFIVMAAAAVVILIQIIMEPKKSLKYLYLWAALALGAAAGHITLKNGAPMAASVFIGVAVCVSWILGAILITTKDPWKKK